MVAANYDLTCEQGATFSRTLTWEDESGPKDLTAASVKMQVRPLAGGTLLIELSTTNSRIAVTPLEGKITLTIAASDTSALTSGEHRYDLEVTLSGGEVIRLIEGRFTVIPEITV